jgi:hypothetical protein
MYSAHTADVPTGHCQVPADQNGGPHPIYSANRKARHFVTDQWKGTEKYSMNIH